MQIEAVKFDYSTNINVVSMQQFDQHIRLYEGYVNKVNEIQKEDADDGCEPGNSTYSENRSLRRGESYALNAVVLHELYFQNIGGKNMKPSDGLNGILVKNFGGYTNWTRCFTESAKSARGWLVLAFEQRSKRYINMLLDTHDNGQIIGTYPLVVLDMYEHAYFMDYGANKDRYIDSFLNNINWDVVNGRFQRLTQTREEKESRR